MAVKRAIQVYCRADQSQVGEGLGEVPQRLTRGADLLGVEPEMVRVGEHLLEDCPGLLDPPGPGERLDVPERAEVEGAFAAVDPVVAGDGVPVDEAVGGEFGADAVKRGQDRGSVGPANFTSGITSTDASSNLLPGCIT